MIHAAMALFLIIFTVKSMSKSNHELVEVVSPSFQKNSLEADSPINGLYISANDTIFILGFQNIWTLEVTTGSIQKILVGQQKNGFINWAVNKNSIAAISQKTLKIINFKDLKAQTFTLAPQTPGKSLHVVDNSEGFSWIHESGIYQYRKGQEKISLVQTEHNIRADDLITESQTGSQFWIARENLLSTLALGSSSNRMDVKLKGFYKFKQIKRMKDLIVLTSEKSIIIANSNGILKKFIPMTKERHIVASDFQGGFHHYLLNDGTIESYNTQRKQVSSVHLPIESIIKGKNIKFIKRGPIISIAANGRVKSYVQISSDEEFSKTNSMPGKM